MRSHRTSLLGILAVLILAACGPSGPAAAPRADRPEAAPVRPAAPQRALLVAFSTEPLLLERSLTSGSGVNDWAAYLSAFLAYTNPDTTASPYLAAELPSLERGTWKLLPDGGMETTYKLRDNGAWHDGAPVTAHDFVFAHRVRVDPELAVSARDTERRISRASAIDNQTLLLEWKELYIWAGMISMPFYSPLPTHLLESHYSADKASFLELPHWRSEFIGAGPYKLESWQQGAEMTLRAHDRFVLGKPGIERIQVRFIADANTIVANLLGGAVDIAFHSSIGFSQNQALEQAGWAGVTEYWRGNPRYVEFQTRDWGNFQRAVQDVRVRRAMLHAFDRQEIIDGLYAGKTHQLHYWLPPDDPANPVVDRSVTKYAYDPARAEALLREAGWTKASDGVARNVAGEPLHMSLLNQSGEIDQLEAAVLANRWKDVGITSETQVLSRAQQGDGEFRSKFPAVSFNRTNFDYETFPSLRSKVTSPQNRWTGTNRIGYVNPVIDEYWTRAMGTLDAKEREPLFVEVFKAMTADAVVTPTHLQPRAFAYAADLIGPKESSQNAGALVWNSWEWHWR
jgi:peptide/nickel transport system substrate-binding protein